MDEENRTPLAVACAHAELWLARDGLWYCANCSPPHFPTEVLDRRAEQEVMRLFDVEQAPQPYRRRRAA